MRAVVVGLARSGRSVAHHLLRRGWEVVAVDDFPTGATRAGAADLGIELREAPAPGELVELARTADLVVVSPGVPAAHPVFSLGGAEVVSEVELAARWSDIPMVAVTGTNGKTTVVTMIERMLTGSGRLAVSAGNIGLPLVDAVHGEGGNGARPDVLVVEVSSFQLSLTATFRPRVAVWLNLAEDHLDWHPDMAHYAAAKARIWRNQAGEDLAVFNAEDPAVMAAVTDPSTAPPALRCSFGLATGDYRVVDGVLTGTHGGQLLRRDELSRALPHDVANGLAAAAAALAAGATPDSVRAVLRDFEGLPHRVALVGESGGVRFYDDSKATTPASVLAALAGFDSVVLIAGGRNKGLDLSVLRDGAGRVRSVVSIGDAAGEVEAAFAGLRPVCRAGSMEEAVDQAAAAARPGDAVLLSPGCASFDWYRSYAERGDDFAGVVRRLISEGASR